MTLHFLLLNLLCHLQILVTVGMVVGCCLPGALLATFALLCLALHRIRYMMTPSASGPAIDIIAKYQFHYVINCLG